MFSLPPCMSVDVAKFWHFKGNTSSYYSVLCASFSSKGPFSCKWRYNNMPFSLFHFILIVPWTHVRDPCRSPILSGPFFSLLFQLSTYLDVYRYAHIGDFHRLIHVLLTYSVYNVPFMMDFVLFLSPSRSLHFGAPVLSPPMRF